MSIALAIAGPEQHVPSQSFEASWPMPLSKQSGVWNRAKHS